MNITVSAVDKFHKRRVGKLVFGAAELLASYLFISRAIDTGSIWEWLVGLLLLLGALNNLVRMFLPIRGNKKDDNKSKS